MREVRDSRMAWMRRTDGQYYEERLEKIILLRNNETLPRFLATFCMENISRGRQRGDRVEIKRENWIVYNIDIILFTIYKIACFFVTSNAPPNNNLGRN